MPPAALDVPEWFRNGSSMRAGGLRRRGRGQGGNSGVAIEVSAESHETRDTIAKCVFRQKRRSLAVGPFNGRRW
jgi:hypothetical protein